MLRPIRICTIGLLVTALSSCEGDYIPKPKGYFRIHLAEKNYERTTDDCPFSFEYPDICEISNKNSQCWMNIQYPKHNATVHLTYKVLDEKNKLKILKDASNLAYEHTSKAEGIEGTRYANDGNKTYGMLFDIYGNAASNIQFFATDSSKHLLRGSLYFNSVPNSDSIAPVKDYIRQDIVRIMESLEWKN